MIDKNHEGCTGHMSVIRGVCVCTARDTVFINPRLFRTGFTGVGDFIGLDYEAFEVACALIDLYFPGLEGCEDEACDISIQMPGMVGDATPLTGAPGFELFRGGK